MCGGGISSIPSSASPSPRRGFLAGEHLAGRARRHRQRLGGAAARCGARVRRPESRPVSRLRLDRRRRDQFGGEPLGQCFTAATAVARGEQWSFRMFAIRFGSDVYRLIFAARNLTPELDKQFRAPPRTFRRVASDEAQSVKPLRHPHRHRRAWRHGGEDGRPDAGVDHPMERFPHPQRARPGFEALLRRQGEDRHRVRRASRRGPGPKKAGKSASGAAECRREPCGWPRFPLGNPGSWPLIPSWKLSGRADGAGYVLSRYGGCPAFGFRAQRRGHPKHASHRAAFAPARRFSGGGSGVSRTIRTIRASQHETPAPDSSETRCPP